ncbi:MAG: dihydroorotate dehydrogenase electron transfer subunit [Prolixibacteraceae bacterium]|nr:dihydroorotate dehydrogenase electron transfer subunit [Prolixibacteraceae bacterium]
MNKRVEDLEIISCSKLNYNNYLLELRSQTKLEGIKPGQFVNVLVGDSPSTFLRRPFSINNVDYSKNSISILVKEVGEGTKSIVSKISGEKLNIVFPLGNGFSLPVKGEKILLVGGGVGIAPMLILAKESKAKGADVHILLGARNENDHILLGEFAKYGKIYLTTDDGSLGTKGFVVDHPVLNENTGINRIYCCGPEVMMRSVAIKAISLNTDCEVSLENLMACGFGVCLCCVTKTNDGNKCVCTEGPVFNINDLQWEI